MTRPYRWKFGPALLSAVLGQSAESAIAGDSPLVAAIRSPDAAGPVQIVEMPSPLPLPGQLMPLAASRATKFRADPRARVLAANQAARVQPAHDGFINAMQAYPWTDGALYQVYTAPGEVTDIALQPGEQLVGTGPVAAGDTVRWIIGDTVSGTDDSQRVHILAKPIRAGLATNLVINTDRRTYHLELRATLSTYMASVSWIYPQDQLIALSRHNDAIAAKAPVASGISLASLHFGYRIDGDTPPWRPLRVFDDGHQLFIEFPVGIAQNEMPPLFVLGVKGAAELVNYRVQDRFMVVDRLFDAGELRLGDKHGQERVRITALPVEDGRK